MPSTGTFTFTSYGGTELACHVQGEGEPLHAAAHPRRVRRMAMITPTCWAVGLTESPETRLAEVRRRGGGEPYDTAIAAYERALAAFAGPGAFDPPATRAALAHVTAEVLVLAGEGLQPLPGPRRPARGTLRTRRRRRTTGRRALPLAGRSTVVHGPRRALPAHRGLSTDGPTGPADAGGPEPGRVPARRQVVCRVSSRCSRPRPWPPTSPTGSPPCRSGSAGWRGR